MTSYRVDFLHGTGGCPTEVYGLTGPHDPRLGHTLAEFVYALHGRRAPVEVRVDAVSLSGTVRVDDGRDGKGSNGMWCAGPFVLLEIADRTCRVCGCTDSDTSACLAATGEPCWWIDDGRDTALCSRCA